MQREAAGDALQVVSRKGKVQRSYPLVLSVNRKEKASCTLSGGIGYVPVTFTGLSFYRGFELLVDGQPLDQAVHGNDSWQTDYDEIRQQWRLTFNVPRDGCGPSHLDLRRISR